ncbi:hypothetical protein BDW59DRAFT_160445 [Aspergillus cavernicola]|uniref:Enoyl reductase (ER) domain-containing protein n=1 Tax=Aspergillus cavernicola TaxID=176166 RepID=A0ABR4IIW4_9EURO
MAAEEQQNAAWTISQPGLLTMAEPPLPRPGHNQALIRICAVSLNYRDHVVLQHSPHYPILAKQNLVPCSDGAGILISTGPGSIWASRIGDAVTVHPNTWQKGEVSNFVTEDVLGAGDIDGTLQRYIVLPDEQIKEAPKNLTMEEATTLPTAGLTAWNALFMGPVECRAGVTVLTLGTGGVSCFAIQLAAAAGATVIATSSSDEKLETARKLGAQYLINYKKTPEWSQEVHRITNGRGVDHVVDVAGASSIEESLRSARQGGLVSVLGMLSESRKTDLTPLIMLGGKTIRGVLGAGSGAMSEELGMFIQCHDIHPIIAKVFTFDQAVNAFAELEKHSEVGKIIIKV